MFDTNDEQMDGQPEFGGEGEKLIVKSLMRNEGKKRPSKIYVALKNLNSVPSYRIKMFKISDILRGFRLIYFCSRYEINGERLVAKTHS